MCTAAVYQTRDFYFGRNLDLDCSYGESVAVTPRRYPFPFRMAPALPSHYAMIGMAHMAGEHPLYYEAVNEKGLGMAGLNFPVSACYREPEEGKDNIASFEVIPWLLGQCATLSQARELLGRLNVIKGDFSREMPAATLHWFLASREGALTVEPVEEGLKVYENPVGVLTNEPPFPFQMTHLTGYMALSPRPPENRFAPQLRLSPCSLGMGSVGLPGDPSSASRFVKAAFVKLNSRSGTSESESVSQFFHILGSVAQQRGIVDLGGGKYETTVYSCCCNADKGIYYYTTYENSQITEVSLRRENLDGSRAAVYPMLWGQCVRTQN